MISWDLAVHCGVDLCPGLLVPEYTVVYSCYHYQGGNRSTENNSLPQVTPAMNKGAGSQIQAPASYSRRIILPSSFLISHF